MNKENEIAPNQQRKHGVKSIDVGMRVLKALVNKQGQTTLQELSEATNLHPAKVHRYLVSLVNTGFVEHTSHGRYDLGSYALEFATSYLSRLDPTMIAGPIIEELWSQTDQGIILCVWGESGTTVIRWLQSRLPISVGIRPGSIFLTTMSAAGRIFLSYLPSHLTRSTVENELASLNDVQHPLAPKNNEDIQALIEQTRKLGLARVEGHSIEYVSAIAAPIFNYRGRVALALSLFGFKTSFDASWDGPNAELVKSAAEEISKQLGYIPNTNIASLK